MENRPDVRRELRHQATHRFLKWAGPAVVLTVTTSIGLVAALAQGFPRVRRWGERLFDDWWSVVTAPLFIALLLFVVLAYLAALIYTGRRSQEGGKMDRMSLGQAWKLALESNVMFPGEAEVFAQVLDQAVQQKRICAWDRGGQQLAELGCSAYRPLESGALVMNEDAEIYFDSSEFKRWIGPPPKPGLHIFSVFGSSDVQISGNTVRGGNLGGFADIRNSQGVRMKDNTYINLAHKRGTDDEQK